MMRRAWPCSEAGRLRLVDFSAALFIGLVILALWLSIRPPLTHPFTHWLLAMLALSVTHMLREAIVRFQERRASRRWSSTTTCSVLKGGPLRFFGDCLVAVSLLLAAITLLLFGISLLRIGGFRWPLMAAGMALLVFASIDLVKLAVWHGVHPRIEVDPECIRVVSTDGHPWMARWEDQPSANESLRGNRIALTDRNHPYQRTSMNGVPVTHAYLQNLLDYFREHPADTADLGTPEGLDILKRITS
ncbi:hypothetical protein [Actinomyces culturomici]|uniref:hypothetical protein n=1 Tax=Actinomyces culturomici TaxID=1926276 RepID=UPI001C5512A1|nr:hypothetical protein [Actinomyces culturomici]